MLVRLVRAVIAAVAVLGLPLTLTSGAYAQRPAWNYVGTAGMNYGLFRGGNTTVYDPISNEMIVFSGFSQDPSQGNPHVNDVWIVSNANGLNGSGTWINLLPNGAAGSPPGRHNGSAVYDAANNRMMVFGGCLGGCFPVDNSVWVLVNANGQGGTPNWQQLSPSGGPPPARQAHQAVYDPNTNSMIIWGGQDGGGSCGGYTDVWVLSNANGLGGTPSWTQLFPTGTPPSGQQFSNALYDPTHNVMIVFGGSNQAGSCNQQPTNGVWTLSNANGNGGTPQWTQLSPKGKLPAARQDAAAVYNPNSNRLTIFGGNAQSAAVSDVWVLKNANGLAGLPSWKQVKPTYSFWQPGVGGRWNCAGVDVINDRMIITLGNVSADGPIWSTWALSDADDR